MLQWIRVLWQSAQVPEVKRALQILQAVSSLLFVVLYVWSTYSTPTPNSLRANVDLTLCAVFAIEYIARFAVRSLAQAAAPR